MRALTLVALGFIAWVSYAVANARPRAPQHASPNGRRDDIDRLPDPASPPKGNGAGSRRSAPARRRIRWSVRVPASTPANAAVYVAGSHPSIGDWSPLGLLMLNDGHGLFRGEVDIPAGTVLEYKFTRGSWEAVETWRGGAPRPNRALTVHAPEMVHAEVEAWSDRS